MALTGEQVGLLLATQFHQVALSWVLVFQGQVGLTEGAQGGWGLDDEQMLQHTTPDCCLLFVMG